MPTQVTSDRMSYEEFLTSYDGQHAEWVGGEVVPMTPPSDQHQNVVGFLAALFRMYAEAKGLGVVRSSPFQMKPGPELPGREPDVLFVSGDHADRLRRTHLEGPADLVVEVISPESRGRDRGDKYFEYEQAGVREYWLIDPVRRQAELYRLGERGVYEVMPAGDPPRLQSEVLPGLWIDLSWLWSDPMPSLMSVLRDWGLV